MKTKKKRLNYQGETIYVGIDIPKRSWNVSIVLSGIKLSTFSMVPNVKALFSYLVSHYPNGIYKVVYEAGFSGYWLSRELQSLGIETLIVNPADIPTSNKERDRKSDKVDSGKLARELSKDDIEGIYIPNKSEEALRVLTRIRNSFTKDQTRLKNRIKSLLYFVGMELPENYEMQHWSKRFIEHITAINFTEEGLKVTMDELLCNLEQIRLQLTRIIKELRNIVNGDSFMKTTICYLQSIPGIGFITAVTLYSEIIDINRFSKLEKLCSYVGIVPSCHSSGEKDITPRMSKRQNSFLRNIIIEASWVAIRKDTALTLAFAKLSQRMKKQEAIIRIAKKLVSRIMYVWKNQTEYVYSVSD